MSASPAAVRSFARAAGIPVGTRGKINPDAIAAFNKGKRAEARYVQGEHVPTVAVKVKGARRAVNVNLSDFRAAAREAGLTVGARGRVSSAALAAFAAGTLSEYAASQNG